MADFDLWYQRALPAAMVRLPIDLWEVGRVKTKIRHPASCPLAAGQARALAGWPRACIQPVSDLCMMHA